MPTSGEHKTVQARILEYAKAIGWTVVSREKAERRRGFDPPSPFGYGAAGVREFNPRYAEAEGVPHVWEQLRHLHTDLYGNPPSSKATARQAGNSSSTFRKLC